MFYSHEILTSRKYGVATVWLVATLGAKSGMKKVSRKQILDVDVGKACDTIIAPEAPMALRLQSNLLYGVSRVYDQQCGYVLYDAQAAQSQIRALLRVVKSNDLDASSAKARREQLILMDDPAFNPDMALPALEFDFGNLELQLAGESQNTMLSFRGRSGSVSSLHSAPSINLPSSSHASAFQFLNDPFSHAPVQKRYPGGLERDLYEDEHEPLLFQDDDGLNFEFGEDGEMRDIDVNEVAARRALGSDAAASGRVQKEHKDTAVSRILPELDGKEGFAMMDYGGDDMPMLPDAEPFSVASASHARSGKPRPGLQDQVRYSEEPASSESAEAPQKKRKSRSKTVMAADKLTELRSTDLISWQKEYLDNMTASKLLKINKKSGIQGKKNAQLYVYGAGLNGVGNGVGSSKIPSPLDMFSGASLLALVTGIPPEPATPKRKNKRALESKEQSSPKRFRQEDRELRSDEMGRAYYDDAGMMVIEDTSQPEMGRDAASTLQDYPSSALMPWNISQSLKSSIGRLPSRRVTSASPLVGRGASMSDIGGLDMLDDPVIYGRDDPTPDDDIFLRRGQSVVGGSTSQADNDFEMFGAAAQVDTQTAGNTQWVRNALDHESGNFHGYVRNSIAEKYGEENGDDGAELSMDKGRFVTFEELFEPRSNSRIVAAQAFYHVLTLCSRRRVWAEQDVDEIRYEPFEEIRIGVLA